MGPSQESLATDQCTHLHRSLIAALRVYAWPQPRPQVHFEMMSMPRKQTTDATLVLVQSQPNTPKQKSYRKITHKKVCLGLEKQKKRHFTAQDLKIY